MAVDSPVRLLTLLMLVGTAENRVYMSSVAVRNTLRDSEDTTVNVLMKKGFGFDIGGEVHFSMMCPYNFRPAGNSELFLLFCNTGDAREFERMEGSTGRMNFDCYHLSTPGDEKMSRADAFCNRQKVLYNTSSSPDQYVYNAQMEYSYFYKLILLQCQQHDAEQTSSNFSASIECRTTLRAMNPGDNHLSTDEMPLPLIYTVINLLWATLVAAWFFNWVIYFKFSNRLHRLISCAPIFKVILVVLVLLWWQEISNTGTEPTDISTVRYFVQSIEDALLFITMMIIAEGWGVVRGHIKHFRWTSLLLLFMIFATSLMCVHWVHRYFLAFSVCCVVFMMYKTLKWSSHNIEMLRRRRRKIRRFINRHNLRYRGIITLDMQVHEKLIIYQRFRIICAAFSMAYAIAMTLATFLQEYTYIKALTFEVPELLIYVAIGFIFRLRNFEPYENIELTPPKENIVVVELPDVSIGEVDPHVALGLPLHFKVEKETQTPRRRWRPAVR